MTIKDCLNRTADEHPDSVALRYKQGGSWKTTSFQQLREHAWHVSEMLIKLGVVEGDRVAIYRENSPEWFEIYHGIVAIGAIAVPVDAKLREQEVLHILHDCGVSVLFSSCRFAEILSGTKDHLPGLLAMVMLDCEGSQGQRCDNVEHHTYHDLWKAVSGQALAEGRAFDRMSPKAGSPASLIYTSGTTGRQKGAVLTHQNFISNVIDIAKAIEVRQTDNFMMVLPLHHSFAFTAMLVLPAYIGCQVSLVQSLKTIKANMVECSPTILLVVPLLLEKMLARIMENVRKQKVASFMYKVGLARVIGRKIHQGLGGSLRMIVSGGAPISPVILETWTKLGISVIEGYGITETAPVLTLNPQEAPRIGTVGLPLDGVEIKIHDPNPEGTGEIIARGENVMQGYYNNPEETAKVLIDGWYYTGDLGYFDEKGYLVINGRKKSLIVNREGKNIYPEEIERHVLASEYVLECLAMGYRESGEDAGERVGLIAVANQEVFDGQENENGTRLTDQQIEECVRGDIRLQLAALSDYKRPRRIEVRFNEFEKTTTQKIKRFLYAIDTSGK